MKAYIESFLPLFVAVNVLGILPMYLGLTETMNTAERRRLTLLATATATGIAVLILAAGQLVFSLLGITVNDLRVGGGLILLVLSISNLIFGDYRRRDPRQGEEEVEDISEMGVVPLGIPLIMGPAALTTIILQVGSYGYLWTIVSLLVNLIIVLAVFTESSRISRALGKPASRAIGKVAALLLAGIGIMMIRSGIAVMIQTMRP